MSQTYSTKKLAFLGLMLAIMIILIMVERMLPPLPMLPPQFGKIGLANVIVMYIFFFMSRKEAFMMVILKALFNALLRGPIAGFPSLVGGVLSISFILILCWIFKDKISYVALSIAGAIGHNIGQLAAACVLSQSWILFVAYFPIILIAGAIFGTVTGIFLKIIMPVFERIYRH